MLLWAGLLMLHHGQMLLSCLHVHRLRTMFLHLLRHTRRLTRLLTEIVLRHGLWLRTM